MALIGDRPSCLHKHVLAVVASTLLWIWTQSGELTTSSLVTTIGAVSFILQRSESKELWTHDMTTWCQTWKQSDFKGYSAATDPSRRPSRTYITHLYVFMCLQIHGSYCTADGSAAMEVFSRGAKGEWTWKWFQWPRRYSRRTQVRAPPWHTFTPPNRKWAEEKHTVQTAKPGDTHR